MIRAFIFISIVSAALLLIDFYSYQAVRSAVASSSEGVRKISRLLFWGFTAFSLLTFFAAFIWQFETWPRPLRAYLFSTIMIVILGKLLIIAVLFAEDVTRAVRWIAELVSGGQQASSGMPSISRSKFLGQVAVALGGIPIALGIHGMVKNAYNYKIHRERIALPNLPESFNGLKIVQISDIHSGSFVSGSPVEKGVEMILNEKPDLVFFTGDMVNYLANEMEEFADVFRRVKAKEGVFSIFGNHDYADYVRFPGNEARIAGKKANRQRMIEMHRSLGWDILLNENRILRRGNDSLAVIGCENWSARRSFHTYGDMAQAYRGAEKADVRILLSHDPTHWDAEIRKKYGDIDITFSGHTHGAQFGVEIPGYVKWSPVKYLYKQWAGLYQEGKQYLYVNRGFGFIGYHGRIGILPEITVVELVKA